MTTNSAGRRKLSEGKIVLIILAVTAVLFAIAVPIGLAVVESNVAAEEERAADLKAALKESLGVDEFIDLYDEDPGLWGGYVSAVRVEGSNAYFTLQISSTDPVRERMGQQAAEAMSTLLPANAVDGISWLIVEDASGGVIAQEQPDPRY